MKTQTQIKVVAYAVSGAYALTLFILGIRLPNIATRVLGLIPILLILLFAAFDNYLWRVSPTKHLVRNRPRIGGTWKGSLIPVQPTPGEDDALRDIPVFLVVRQTYTNLSLTLVSGESKSRSLLASIEQRGTDDFSLFYGYQNIPGSGVRANSPIHLGGAALEISGLEPDVLSGDYWTDRLTTGSLRVRRLTKKYVDDFATAQALGRGDA